MKDGVRSPILACTDPAACATLRSRFLSLVTFFSRPTSFLNQLLVLQDCKESRQYRVLHLLKRNVSRCVSGNGTILQALVSGQQIGVLEPLNRRLLNPESDFECMSPTSEQVCLASASQMPTY